MGLPFSSVITSGVDGQELELPTWGRCLWQDHQDSELVCLFASGTTEVDFVYSQDSGNTWSAPRVAFYVDDFSTHNNFDTAMDPEGNIHCAHRYNTSGCYTTLGKNHVGGGWQQSGVIGRGFVDVDDSGPAKGFNGSIEVTPEFVGAPKVDAPGSFPAVRLVAKDSSHEVNMWYVENPYGTFPTLDDFSPGNGVFPAGATGGYPLFDAAGAPSEGRQIIYSVDSTGICQLGQDGEIRVIPVDDPGSSIYSDGTIEGSGYVSRIPLGSSMTRVDTNVFSGPKDDSGAPIFDAAQKLIILSSADNVSVEVEVLAAHIENLLTDGKEDSAANITNALVSLPSSAKYSITTDDVDRAPLPGKVPWKYQTNDVVSSFFPGDVFSKTGASGTLIDASWGNEENTVILYFCLYEPNGEQAIHRLKCETKRDWIGTTLDGVTYPAQRSKYLFSELNHPVSGIRSWAPATKEYTGGSGNYLAWQNFKALRHQTPQWSGVFKREGVVTQGSGLDGTSKLIYWDFLDSIDYNRPTSKLPTYVQHRTLDSGNNDQFLGADSSSLIVSQIDNMFDDDPSSSATVTNGDDITLYFSNIQTFNRIEILWKDGSFGDDFFDVDVDASLDGTNYSRVLTIPGPGTIFGGTRLIKASSEFDVTDEDLDGTISLEMTPFAAKRVRLNFSNATSSFSIYEIRLYGAHNTAGNWVTTSSSKTFVRPPKVSFGRKEDFTTTREGELPVGWTTYGDFEWFVRASGTYSDGVENGYVNEPSVYQNSSNGRSDGFALRTSETGVPQVPSGVITSGVAEVNIVVEEGETDFNGNSGRTIAFDIRHDVVASAPLVTATDPTDDKVIFETVTSTGIQSVLYPARFPVDQNEYCNSVTCPTYTRYRTTVPVGSATLRWIYERGTLDAPNVSNDDTSVWIDNVEGVSLIEQTAIAGFAKGAAFSTSTITGPSGIYAFMEKRLTNIDTPLNAYLNSLTAAITGSIAAFTEGATFISGGLNAYMNTNLSNSLNAYIIGVGLSDSINAYVLNSGSFNSIYGHMQNRQNESVYGFVKAPSGIANGIYAYTLTPQFGHINAYLKTATFISGAINSFLDANGENDGVYAYMLGSGIPSGSINAYLYNNGISSDIFGYMPVGDRNSLYGYIQGATAISGGINAWVSGVGFTSDTLNAYLPGISGTASGNMNAYMSAASPLNEHIWAFLIGFDNGESCNFPLSSVPTVTIPSGNFYT